MTIPEWDAERALAMLCIERITFDKAFIGSCTNGGYSDLLEAALVIRAARAKRCDLIVMASHGRRGVAALVLGSETQKVLTHSKLPVLVVR